MNTELKKVRIKLVDDGKIDSDCEITNYKEAILAAKKYICDCNREIICAICMAGKRPVNFIVLSMGTVNYSLVPVGELIKTALLTNATGVILLHNHPSGNCYPSGEDISLTDKVVRACELCDLKLLDHIIIPANSEFAFSFLEKNLVPINLNKYALTIDDIPLNKEIKNTDDVIIQRKRGR